MTSDNYYLGYQNALNDVESTITKFVDFTSTSHGQKSPQVIAMLQVINFIKQIREAEQKKHQ